MKATGTRQAELWKRAASIAVLLLACQEVRAQGQVKAAPPEGLLLTQPLLAPEIDPVAELRVPDLPDVSVNVLATPSPSSLRLVEADPDDAEPPQVWPMLLLAALLMAVLTVIAVVILSTSRQART